jgi:putative SOS response-associated peptidase YedK
MADVKGNRGARKSVNLNPGGRAASPRQKAMPVILTTPDEVETWMTAPPEEALKLQRPLPDGALRIVARGVKEDPMPTL